MILVDTCVLIDVIGQDTRWCEWSQSVLDEWGRRGPVLINPVIYAELSPDFSNPAALDEILDRVSIEYREISREALFLAARVYQAYRRRGGVRTGVLPDFFVGAHARVLGVPLLTRDPGRFRSYFADLVLVTPEGAQ